MIPHYTAALACLLAREKARWDRQIRGERERGPLWPLRGENHGYMCVCMRKEKRAGGVGI